MGGLDDAINQLTTQAADRERREAERRRLIADQRAALEAEGQALAMQYVQKIRAAGVSPIRFKVADSPAFKGRRFEGFEFPVQAFSSGSEEWYWPETIVDFVDGQGFAYHSTSRRNGVLRALFQRGYSDWSGQPPLVETFAKAYLRLTTTR